MSNGRGPEGSRHLPVRGTSNDVCRSADASPRRAICLPLFGLFGRRPTGTTRAATGAAASAASATSATSAWASTTCLNILEHLFLFVGQDLLKPGVYLLLDLVEFLFLIGGQSQLRLNVG